MSAPPTNGAQQGATMPKIVVRSFQDALHDYAREIVDAVEQLERIRRDVRTTVLLVSARRLLADVQTYFQTAGR